MDCLLSFVLFALCKVLRLCGYGWRIVKPGTILSFSCELPGNRVYSVFRSECSLKRKDEAGWFHSPYQTEPA